MLKKSLYIAAVVALLTGTVDARGMERGHHKAQENKQESAKHQKRANKQNKKRKSQRERYHKEDLIKAVVNGEELTQAQKDDLNYMIEEEKVARDVYTALAKTSKQSIFTNISKSEQKHVDALHTLFDTYGIDVPVSLDDAGHFENDELQTMYNDLVAQGSASVIDALEVGVIVEETDIEDIQKILDAGVPSDFSKVYTNLLNGSYNHLNAFNRQLSK